MKSEIFLRHRADVHTMQAIFNLHHRLSRATQEDSLLKKKPKLIPEFVEIFEKMQAVQLIKFKTQKEMPDEDKPRIICLDLKLAGLKIAVHTLSSRSVHIAVGVNGE